MRYRLFEMEFEFAGLTDTGKKRKENQDRIILDAKDGFFAVSDGMGGLRRGGDAAEYVCMSMPGLMGILTEECGAGTAPEEAAERLKQTAGVLSDTLFRKGNSPTRFDYGATLAGVWLYGDRAVFICLGDSRGYRLRKDETELKQLTEDMNIAGIMVRNGLMTKSEGARSPSSSRLTAFVGMEEPATPEAYPTEVQEGDILLLCSDGLHGLVPERRIGEIIRAGETLEAACGELVKAANARGGRDNISVILIRIGRHKGEAADAGEEFSDEVRNPDPEEEKSTAQEEK